MARLEKLFPVFAVAGITLSILQAAPDFSGRWTAIPESSPPAASGAAGSTATPNTWGSGWGNEVTLTQDSKTLTVERAQFSQYDMQPPMRFTYTLDGAENRITFNMGRGAQDVIARATRQDRSLLITTTYRFAVPDDGRQASIEVKQVLSLDASGALIVTTTRSGLAGGPPSTTTTKYKKG